MGRVLVDPNPGLSIPPLGIHLSSRINKDSHSITTVTHESKILEGNDALPPPQSSSRSDAATYGGDYSIQNPPSPPWSDVATYDNDYYVQVPPASSQSTTMSKKLSRFWSVTKKDSSSTLVSSTIVHAQHRSSPISRGEYDV